MQNHRKFYVKNYGCQMNVYDGDRIKDVMEDAKWAETSDPTAADLVILNTCHIREKAAEKVYSEIGCLTKQKGAGRSHSPIVAVVGCVAQAEGKEILRRAPSVSLVVGPQNYHKLPDLLNESLSSHGGIVETGFPVADKFESLPASRPRAGVPTAFLTIQEGCDKFCTFCVVPYTRGTELSRPVQRILEEATRLIDAGIKEITLLGQNVNAYHGEGPDGNPWSLARLLYRLSEISGLQRLRYITSHPRDMSNDLIEAHGSLSKLMPYLHLPVQSGSDKVLKAMNRRHNRDDYLSIIARLRTIRPDIALSGDFIVGFPGETEEDFLGTMDIVRTAQYASAFSFKYSPRPGTPAATSELQVAEDIKTDRLHRLQQLINEQSHTFNISKIGTSFDILLERTGRSVNQLVGRSPWLQPVHIDANSHIIGDIVNVTIDRVDGHSLFGRIA